jgi:hypothetical protein
MCDVTRWLSYLIAAGADGSRLPNACSGRRVVGAEVSSGAGRLQCKVLVTLQKVRICTYNPPSTQQLVCRVPHTSGTATNSVRLVGWKPKCMHHWRHACISQFMVLL